MIKKQPSCKGWVNHIRGFTGRAFIFKKVNEDRVRKKSKTIVLNVLNIFCFCCYLCWKLDILL